MGCPNVSDPSSDYGLPYSDYAPVADPTTDVSATSFERLAVDAAAMTHTCGRAWVTVSAGASSAGAMMIDHDAMWGDTDGVKPTLARVSTGVTTVTWASTYGDLNPTPTRVTTCSTNIRGALLTPRARCGEFYVTHTSNVVTVQTYNTAHALANINYTLLVF